VVIYFIQVRNEVCIKTVKTSWKAITLKIKKEDYVNRRWKSKLWKYELIELTQYSIQLQAMVLVVLSINTCIRTYIDT
jgi:hypothetical protein